MKRPHINYSQPHFDEDEKKEILSTLDSGWVTLGPKTKQFEEEFANYVGTKYAIGVTSCTAALHLSLLAAGFGPGDEIITTPFTFTATVNTIMHVGATPVLVDIEENTFNIDPTLIEKHITKKTRGIIAVDYGGNPCDYDRITKIAKKNNLIVISDAACGAGGSYHGRKIGSLADMTCFSFHPIKNISTGDGGMITTDNENYAKKLSNLRLHGMNKEAWKTTAWMYDVTEPGYKYNMFDIQAALGIHQLKKLSTFVELREKYARMYDEHFIDIEEITTPYVAQHTEHSRNIYSIRIDFSRLTITRDEFVEILKKRSVGASVYYPPIYLFTYYKDTFGFKAEDYPVTNKIFQEIISLPLFPKMSEEDVLYVQQTVIDIIREHRKPFVYKKDNFDTEITKLHTVKINHIQEGEKMDKHIRDMLKEFKNDGVEYAIYRIRSDKYDVIRSLEKYGFSIVDVMLHLENSNIDTVNKDSRTRVAKNEDVSKLKAIAQNSFNSTRYFNDTVIPKKYANKIYTTWIENSVKGEVADRVFVYEDNDELVGFVTIKKSGNIPLVAVDASSQKKGIGTALVNAALVYIKEADISAATIETQASNVAAVRAYQNNGFKIIGAYSTYRWHNG